MIVHLFNSALVSGPETLVIPAIPDLKKKLGEIQVWNLSETRKGEIANAPTVYAESFGITTHSIPVSRQIDFQAVKLLALDLQKLNPSIVHAHDVKASIYLILSRIYLRLTGQGRRTFKYVSTHHGVHARNGFKIRLYELIYRIFFLRFFNRVLTVCSADRKILLRQGLGTKKIQVHLNGVDRAKVEPADWLTKHEQVLELWESALQVSLRGKMVMGVAARLSPEKNHPFILQALSELKKGTAEIPWVCILFGVGQEKENLKSIVSELNLENEVVFAGYRKNLTQEMAGFDILLSLSLGEGLPINLLEAGWSGSPVLATAVDGVEDLLPETLGDLKESRLSSKASVHEVATRLKLLLREPALRRNLALRFQDRVIHSFSGTAWKNRLLEIYNGL
jgi:glycosyltransferase involved in cell wall biosynthesis